MHTDLERLQGTWNVTALEIDGQALPPAIFAGSRIVVSGDAFTTTSMGAVYEGAIHLDPSQTPKAFNLVFSAGPERGNTSLGIYHLHEDSWQICLTIAGNTRPQHFVTSPGSGHALEMLVRDRTAA